VGDDLDSVRSSIQSLELDINAQVAARTGGASSDPRDLETPEDAASSRPLAKAPTLKQYQKQRNKQAIQDMLGTNNKGVYNPNKLIRNPPKPEDLDLPTLLANQTHLGHHTSLWNPANSSYIYGTREGIHIISLDITYAYLRRAAKVVQEVARRGGLILFIGTRRNQEEIVTRASERAGGYHIFHRWVPGTLTNGQQLLGNCAIKAVDIHDNEVKTITPILASGKARVLRPDLVIVLNPLENEVCLHECGLNTVPTIGVIDTDANPAWVTYPIPANDDSLRSIALIAGVLSQAAAKGQAERLDAAAQGKATYDTRATELWLEHAKVLYDTDISEARSDDGPEEGARMGQSAKAA
jgi:small subunit ribosomal protein S2